MESEMYNLVQVWVAVLLSLSYCYLVLGKITPKGLTRLFGVIPVVCLFLALPLNLRSINLGSLTAFLVAWLANFKILLFAFGKGPLCSHPSISLATFLALASLPIKIPNFDEHPIRNEQHPNSPKWTLNYGTKVVLMGAMLGGYRYSDRIHPKMVMFLFCFYTYFLLEIIQVAIAGLARSLLGIEYERQFNEPYLSTSLQDFWGRRWNLTITNILRPAVYEPVRGLASRAVGRRWAAIPAVMAAFAVSGAMHELLFYYVGRVRPTWGVTRFFLLHGACLAGEIGVKKAAGGRVRLPAAVTGTATFGFVVGTGLWMFVPEMVRSGVFDRGMEENAAVGAFIRDCVARIASESTEI